jgi:hypothetical protein
MYVWIHVYMYVCHTGHTQTTEISPPPPCRAMRYHRNNKKDEGKKENEEKTKMSTYAVGRGRAMRYNAE